MLAWSPCRKYREWLIRSSAFLRSSRLAAWYSCVLWARRSIIVTSREFLFSDVPSTAYWIHVSNSEFQQNKVRDASKPAYWINLSDVCIAWDTNWFSKSMIWLPSFTEAAFVNRVRWGSSARKAILRDQTPWLFNLQLRTPAIRFAIFKDSGEWSRFRSSLFFSVSLSFSISSTALASRCNMQR